MRAVSFRATIRIIGINPYVLLPQNVLNELFSQAGKNKGPIPVKGLLNKHAFTQTLVRYDGKWRLYLNGPMRKAAGIDVGDFAEVSIQYDERKRQTGMHPDLKQALAKNPEALAAFERLAPYLQKEIMRYINQLKTEDSITKNVKRAIGFLTGKERFIGRDPL